MADLIPPVPNEDFQRPYPWWDWFRKIRKNINEFAASITAIVTELANIVTQITAVNSSVSDTFTPQSFTAVTSFAPSNSSAANITTTGSPVLALGQVNLTMDFSSATVPYAINIISYLYRDGTILTASGVSTWMKVSNFSGSSYVGATLPIVFFNTGLGPGTYAYTIRSSMTFYDATGSSVASTGNVSQSAYLFVKEMKT